jgi:hypothetical protein
MDNNPRQRADGRPNQRALNGMSGLVTDNGPGAGPKRAAQSRRLAHGLAAHRDKPGRHKHYDPKHKVPLRHVFLLSRVTQSSLIQYNRSRLNAYFHSHLLLLLATLSTRAVRTIRAKTGLYIPRNPRMKYTFTLKNKSNDTMGSHGLRYISSDQEGRVKRKLSRPG